jgi:acyl-CoA thioester hydrolase
VIVSETDIVVRYCETDQMGIVHHSNYPVWFEAGRTEFFNKLGVRYSQIEKQGVLLPLTGLECDFISPVRYEDEVIVKTRISGFSGIRLNFGYEVVLKADGSLAASGETGHAWTDRSLKPINIKKVMPELHGLIIRFLQE